MMITMRHILISCLVAQTLVPPASCSGGKPTPKNNAPSASTAVRITGVDRNAIARALWKAGSQREKFQLFGSERVQVWPSVEAINKPKAIIAYEIKHFMGNSTYKDIVSISAVKKNTLVVWLKCERKSKPAFYPMFHKREVQRERRIIQKAVWQLLRKHRGASIKKLNGWQPAALPLIVNKTGVKWIAFKGISVTDVLSYIESEDYRKAKGSSAKKIIFTRFLDADPHDTEGLNLFGNRTEWKSREKVVLKDVVRLGIKDQKEPIVVMGILAEGKKRVEEFSLLGPNRVYRSVVGDFLEDSLIQELFLALAIKSEKLRVVDPSPWIEKIKLDPWPAKTETEKHLEEEKKASRAFMTTTVKSRFWQGVLIRNGKKVIVAKYYRYTGKTKRTGKNRHTYIPEFVKEKVYPYKKWQIHLDPEVLKDKELEKKAVFDNEGSE